jgi:hypothetical protein
VGDLVSLEGLPPQGSTKPFFGTARLPEGLEVEALLKIPFAELAVPATQPLNELVATLVAGKAGIQVADCFLFRMEAEVREHLECVSSWTVCSEFGFGAYRVDLDPIAPPVHPGQFPLDEMLRIYVLDMTLVNSDRTPENPNCGQVNGRLFAYDHGAALPAPRSSRSEFSRAYYPPQIGDRSSAHLLAEPLRDLMTRGDLTPSLLRQTVDNVIDCSLSVNCLLAQDDLIVSTWPQHVELLSQFFFFLDQERDRLRSQIVDTL